MTWGAVSYLLKYTLTTPLSVCFTVLTHVKRVHFLVLLIDVMADSGLTELNFLVVKQTDL